jgi:hypothetical protein
MRSCVHLSGRDRLERSHFSLAKHTHVRNEFAFTVRAHCGIVAPLFGAHKERVWAGEEWNPNFVHPNPPEDKCGGVFTVEGHDYTSTWINTSFDLELGHIQYVYFVPDCMVTLIDIHLESRTK